jgi:putative transposase
LEIGKRLKEIIEVLIKESGCQLLAMENEVDHIHLVIKTKPTHQISKLINSYKGVTARKIFQEFPELKNRLWKGHLWAASYFVVTVGGAPLEVIKKYVETQREK